MWPGWSIIRTREARWPSPALIFGKARCPPWVITPLPTEQKVRPCLGRRVSENPLRWWRVAWIKGCVVDLWCNSLTKWMYLAKAELQLKTLYTPRSFVSFHRVTFFPYIVFPPQPRLLSFSTHRQKHTHSLLCYLLICSFFLSVERLRAESVPSYQLSEVEDDFPLSAQQSFLGTFQSTFSCLAICCLVYRAAKPWRHHRLWLTPWTRQSLVHGSVYKQCCTMCPLWPRSHLSLCTFWDLTLKITFYIRHLLNHCGKSLAAVY